MMDSSDISFSANDGSRLLEESLLLPSSSTASSQTGPGGDDLSISELSISDRPRPPEKPFSLLAQHDSEPLPSTPGNFYSHTGDLNDPEDELDEDEDAEKERRHTSKAREEKLQSDIFILKRLNASFALFNEALQGAGSANQRIGAQLEQTDALLNKYIGILSKSETFARLIFDQRWHGADEDEDILEREKLTEMERVRQEAEERAMAAREEERRQQELKDQEERDRIDRENKERLNTRGGIRGVRGTRASMRGTRGAKRTAPGAIMSDRRHMGSATGSTASKLPTASAARRS